MVNRVGASSVAATVWPRSTSRPITTPSIGARITVRSRSTSAWSSAACCCWTAACGVLQVGRRHRQAGLGGAHRRRLHDELGLRRAAQGAGRFGVGHRPIDLARGDGAALQQRAPPGELALGVGGIDTRALRPRLERRAAGLRVGDLGARLVERRPLDRHRRPRHRQRRLGLAHACGVGLRIQRGERLTLDDLVVEVDQQLGDLPGELRADLHRDHGIQRAGRGDRGPQVAALDRHAQIDQFGTPLLACPQRQTHDHECNRGDCYPPRSRHLRAED